MKILQTEKKASCNQEKEVKQTKKRRRMLIKEARNIDSLETRADLTKIRTNEYLPNGNSATVSNRK